MPDMLVKLYTLPDLAPPLAAQRDAGVDIRRALAPEQHVVIDWVRATFHEAWASEGQVCFGNHPVSCFIAVEGGAVVGFACYDAVARGFFGPTGVQESHRRRGIGTALLLACLHAMAAVGYGYAIIGDVGPADFYSRAVGAMLIEDSTPGIYRGMLRSQPRSEQ